MRLLHKLFSRPRRAKIAAALAVSTKAVHDVRAENTSATHAGLLSRLSEADRARIAAKFAQAAEAMR